MTSSSNLVKKVLKFLFLWLHWILGKESSREVSQKESLGTTGNCALSFSLFIWCCKELQAEWEYVGKLSLNIWALITPVFRAPSITKGVLIIWLLLSFKVSLKPLNNKVKTAEGKLFYSHSKGARGLLEFRKKYTVFLNINYIFWEHFLD